ncbi:hypothetical protein TGRH88_084550 [Toxoplasma gondii]|uniref:Uncharacterized protein n=1 Tax=Toxoplasma gondii TaxID=5811 RepID=A0A7J6KHA3_TOXGO|nr:hypothetical protein TGRH88_084550 [Toxoplasma gondii]
MRGRVACGGPQGSGRYDSLGYLGERVNPGSSHVHGASQRVDSGDGGGDVIMRWGLPSNASRAQDRQDDSTPVELEIRFHSVTVAVDMELEVRDSEQACSVVRRSCHYMSRLGFGYTVQRGASQRVDSGDGGGDVIMRWGLPSNASRVPGLGKTTSTPGRAGDPISLCHSCCRYGVGRYDSLGYLGERVNPGSSHVHGECVCGAAPADNKKKEDRQDDSTPVELEIRFHSVTVAVDMELEVRDSEQACSVVRRSCHYMSRLGSGTRCNEVCWVDGGRSGGGSEDGYRVSERLEVQFESGTMRGRVACGGATGVGRYDSLGYLGERVNPGSSHVHGTGGASQRVDSGDGGGDVIMRWGLPSNASRAQDRQDDSTPVELEIRFHSVTVAVDMDRQDDSTPVELEIRFHSVTVAVDMVRGGRGPRRVGAYDSLCADTGMGASQRVDSGDGGGDVIMRWGLPSNASRAQDRQDDSTPVELEIRFHSVTVAVDMGSGRYDSLGYLGERVNPGSSHVHGASQRVDSGDGGGDVIMRWGLPSNASRAQDRQDDSTPVELEIRFHSVTVAVDMGSGRYDSLGYLGERVNPGSSHVHGASQRVDSGDGGGDVIMRWGLPSNASRAQDRQDDSTPVELEIRFHSVTVAVDMVRGGRGPRRVGAYDSLCADTGMGASQRVDSGDGGGDVIMRWGLPSNASRAQDRQDDSTPVELEIRFHSVTVAVDMVRGGRGPRRVGAYDSLCADTGMGASQRVDSGDGGGDVIMRWGLPSNASRAQDRQDDSTPVELEIRFHSVTVAVDMVRGGRGPRRVGAYDSLCADTGMGASQRVDSGDGGGDVIMRWGLPSNASRAQDRQDDSTPVELEIRFHSVTVAVDMGSGRYDSLGYLGERVNPGSSHAHGASQRVDSGDGGGDVIMRWGLPSNASRAQDRQDDSTPVELEIRFHSVTVAVDMVRGGRGPRRVGTYDSLCADTGMDNGGRGGIDKVLVCVSTGPRRSAMATGEGYRAMTCFESVWEMVGRFVEAREASEVPPQMTARGPTSLWHELSTCWVWRRHMVRPVYDMRFVECMRGWVRGYWLCVVMQSVWEMVGRIAQARESVCDIVGRIPQASESVWEMVGRIAQAREIREQKDAGACGGGGSAADDSQRSDVAVARIVDVLGVAAPHESECPAWDAWANPVAEANDPSSLVSEYAACGVLRPHTVLPFSRMSLVAYLRGWVWESVWEMVGRIAQAREVREHKDAGACGVGGSAADDSQRSDVAVARIVDVLGVAAPHGPAVVWYATRRVNARIGGGGSAAGDSQRSDVAVARSVDVLRLVAPQLSGGCNSLGYVSVCGIVGCILQAAEGKTGETAMKVREEEIPGRVLWLGATAAPRNVGTTADGVTAMRCS